MANSNEPLPTSSLNLQKRAASTPLPPNIPPTDDYGMMLPRLLPAPRACTASAGVMWVVQAFSLFQRQALLWLGMGATLLIILGILGAIPFLNIFMVIIVFIFVGGIVKGAAAQSQGDELRFDYLFSGFKSHGKPLLILGLLYLLGTIVCMIPMIIGVGSVAFFLSPDNYNAMHEFSISGLIIGYLLSMLLSIPLMMAIWFAPALIVLHDIDAITALKKSFQGCKKNLIPLFVYGLMCLVVFPMVILFTLGLGIFLVIPILLLTYFTSYRDVWTDQPLNAH